MNSLNDRQKVGLFVLYLIAFLAVIVMGLWALVWVFTAWAYMRLGLVLQVAPVACLAPWFLWMLWIYMGKIANSIGVQGDK